MRASERQKHPCGTPQARITGCRTVPYCEYESGQGVVSPGRANRAAQLRSAMYLAGKPRSATRGTGVGY